MDPLQTALHASLAAIAAALLIAVDRAPPLRSGRLGVGLSLAGPALALAIIWQFLIQEGRPVWGGLAGPSPKWHSLVWFVVAMAVVGVLIPCLFHRVTSAAAQRDGAAPGAANRPVPNGLVVAVVGFAVTLLFLRAPLLHERNPAHVVAMLGLLFLPLAGRVAICGPRLAMPLSFVWSFAALAGLAIEAAAFAKLGTIAATAAGATVGMIVIGWRLGLSLSPYAAITGLAAVGGIAAVGAPYASATPGWIWLGPALAPFAVTLAQLPPLRRRPALASVIRYALPAAIAFASVAVAIALKTSGPSAGDDDGAAYYGGS